MITDNLYKFVAPCPRGWRRAIGPVLVTIITVVVGVYALSVFFLPMFFSSTHFTTRIAIRGVYLPFVKYVWVHLILTSIEGLHVDHEKNQFLILTIPMAVVTAAGHLMSFAAGSLFEAMAMEGLSAGFEVLEYYT